MYKTIKDGQELAVALKRELYKIDNVDIVICPAYTLLAYLADDLEDSNIVIVFVNHFKPERIFRVEFLCAVACDGNSGVAVYDFGYSVLGELNREDVIGNALCDSLVSFFALAKSVFVILLRF